MVCDSIQNNVQESQSQKHKQPKKSTAGSKRRNIKKIPKDPPVPAYALDIGKSYDVIGIHTSVYSAEYIGYEVIGRLILYCFLRGNQPYKFSEIAVRQGGGIRESGS